MRPGQLESAAIPDADYVDARPFAQAAVQQGLAGQTAVHHRGFRHHQTAEAAHDAGPLGRADHPSGHGLTQHIMELEHPVASCQAQDVRRIGIFHPRGDDHLGRGFTGREDDVGTADVRIHDHQHGGRIGVQFLVGLYVVMVTGSHFIALVEQVQTCLGIIAQQHTPDTMARQVIGQVEGDGAASGDQHMPPDPGGQTARHHVLFLAFQPRHVKMLDEGEGHHDQEKDHARHEHDDGKDAARIRGKGDVPKTERGHDRQRPVDPGDPGMFLPFIFHEPVEDDAVSGDHDAQGNEKAPQHDHIVLCAALVQKGHDL